MAREINLFEDLTTGQYSQNEDAGCEFNEHHDSTTIFEESFTFKQIKNIIEALLFASNEPLSIQKIREITDAISPLRPKEIRRFLQSLQEEYIAQQRAFRLEEIAEGFLLQTSEEYSLYIDQLHRNKRTEKLSQAAAEVMAIIAYKQPITRPQIDAIRGVDSSGTIQNLLERQLIEPSGKLEVPGRPTLYCTTKDFLKHFGLRTLKDLPPLSN